MRLQKFMAHAGVASRRKCEQMILDGQVKVNGVVCTELGVKVSKQDVVEVDGSVIHLEQQFRYIMLNKPTGYVTTNDDQFDRSKVIDLIEGIDERIYPIGRLDYNTSGLLLLTNDGELANKLMHPKANVMKTYVAVIDKPYSKEIADVFHSGIVIDGRKTMPAKIKKLGNAANGGSVCEVRISEGRNRQIRRLFEACGCRVIKLERVAIGHIQLDELEEGQYRDLTEQEIGYLKSL